jgi:hypothetical protein
MLSFSLKIFQRQTRAGALHSGLLRGLLTGYAGLMLTVLTVW